MAWGGGKAAQLGAPHFFQEGKEGGDVMPLLPFPYPSQEKFLATALKGYIGKGPIPPFSFSMVDLALVVTPGVYYVRCIPEILIGSWMW